MLQGWQAIAHFLAQTVGTAQGWARSGMPVRRQGRYVVADPEELRAWIGKEAGMKKPAHIATDSSDLSEGLRESLAAARKGKHGTGQ